MTKKGSGSGSEKNLILNLNFLNLNLLHYSSLPVWRSAS